MGVIMNEIEQRIIALKVGIEGAIEKHFNKDSPIVLEEELIWKAIANIDKTLTMTNWLLCFIVVALCLVVIFK
jgi:hypothetical protein